ncbi:MAG: phosphatidylserine/phosphatidylglycerophosphate/cardiolipin synthase family protein [Waddliaceae bacterium]
MRHLSTTIKATFWIAVLSFFLFSFFQIGRTITKARIPQPGAPAELYSTQTRDDLKLTFSQAINEAENSVLLIIYSLKDSKIIQALKKKSEERINVEVICDTEASRGVARKLGSKVKTSLCKGKGLMHQKILVIDNKKVWIGSANMTPTSLRWHNNLVTGLQSPKLAANIKEKAHIMIEEGRVRPVTTEDFNVGDQKAEMWFLPDNPTGAYRIRQLFRTAQKTIRIAMFTWTRLDFADDIVKAQKRGLDIQVAIDAQSGGGVSAKVVERLQNGGVPVRLSKGGPLLHYKFMVIDDRILVNGSANWTKAAFTQNDDCFIILYDLTEDQQQFLDNLWSVIREESTLL